jgi:uncharacterized protein (DUF1800 family)
VRPVLDAILCSPELYDGPTMVKPPVVFAAGLLRATGQTITRPDWIWECSGAGQMLFHPPDVSGWDDTRWLDTNTLRGRWDLVTTALAGHTISPVTSGYAETPAEAVTRARAFWNDPRLTSETVSALSAWSSSALATTAGSSLRAQRQNALRMIVGMSPDHQVS